jgi:hypothetical protein
MSINPCGDHLSDDRLERYAMEGERMKDGFAETEEHLLVCAECRNRLEEFEQWLEAFRRVKIDTCVVLTVVHETETGPFYLHLERLGPGRWNASFRGLDLEGKASFGTRAEAIRHLLRSFGEMFPGHRCGLQCRVTEYVAA